jgi:hypothetical protein
LGGGAAAGAGEGASVRVRRAAPLPTLPRRSATPPPSQDEPTTGLDARAAAIVVRALKGIAATNRTVMVTM